MANATKDLLIPQRDNSAFGYPALAGERYFKKAILAVTAGGFAVPAQHADALKIVGLVEMHVDNRDGPDEAENVIGLRGCFGFDFAADEVDLGRSVYAEDDQTLSFDPSGGKLLLGSIAGFGDGLTWIELPVASAPAEFLSARIATLVGAGVTRTVAPVSGRLVRMTSVIDGVLTTGNATITASINGVAVTGGVITITQAGSAAGDVDEAEPSALNVVAAGDVIGLTVGGTNATATPATVILEIAQ